MLAKLALLKSVPLTYVAAAAVGSAGAIGAVGWHLTRTSAPTELAAATTAPAAAPAVKAPEAAPSVPAVAQPAPPKPEAPAFDIARIEPSGEAVIAGRAAPGAKVELLRPHRPATRAGHCNPGKQCSPRQTIHRSSRSSPMSINRGLHFAPLCCVTVLRASAPHLARRPCYLRSIPCEAITAA